MTFDRDKYRHELAQTPPIDAPPFTGEGRKTSIDVQTCLIVVTKFMDPRGYL
jgi:hypothetical protein